MVINDIGKIVISAGQSARNHISLTVMRKVALYGIRARIGRHAQRAEGRLHTGNA